MTAVADIDRKAAIRFIICLGIVSMFADMTYEGAHSVIGPLLSELGSSATQVGIIAGIGEMFAASLRLFSGRLADKTRAYWTIAIFGYAINIVVVPAIANTLSLKDFTDRAMKVVDDSSVGYLNALNYDVAFYSRRTIPIVSQKDPDLPRYLIAWRTLFDALPASKRSRFEIVMESNPTSLDGSDEMLLLRQRAGATTPPPKPSDDYIQAEVSKTNSPVEFPRPPSPAAAARPPTCRAS